MMNIVAVIPARMESSRFPGKPMAQIHGMPMIGHCLKRAEMSDSLNGVYVATCDEEIHDYIKSIGGKSIMTKDTHERACDRAAEAMSKIESQTDQKVDILLMLQGDEPMINDQMIKAALKPLIDDPEVKISNLYREIESVDEFEDPNEVKVVLDNQGNALYFSREPIPSRKKGHDEVPMYKQICSIPFRRDYLLEFNEMEQTRLEIIESIDMNRIIENGQKVKMEYSEYESFSVDNEADLQRVIQAMKDDPLIPKYIGG
mgnify:CR=1 FL=1